jgi:hypothetical protein
MSRPKGVPLSPANRKWLLDIRACEKSGESLKSYAERKGISVHALYQAKKVAREKGILPPHRKGKAPLASSRRRRPARFVKAVQCVEAREAGAAWRLRLPGGAVFESMAPLNVDETLRLVELLRQQP